MQIKDKAKIDEIREKNQAGSESEMRRERV